MPGDLKAISVYLSGAETRIPRLARDRIRSIFNSLKLTITLSTWTSSLLLHFVTPSSLGDEEYSTPWIINKQKIVETANKNRDNNAIEALSALVRRLGQDRKKLNPEGLRLLIIANQSLQNTPKYSEYLLDKIQKTTQRDITMTSAPEPNPRYFYYQVLQNIRNPKSVEILGNLLNNEKDYWADVEEGDAGRPQPNARMAMDALSESGLRNAPTSGPFPEYPGALRSWKLWFEQVKAGTRTFSFEGDDHIYSLAGPVAVEAVPAENSPRPESPTTSTATSAATSAAHPSKWPVWIAVTALACSLAAFFVGKRRGAVTGK